MTAKQYYLPTNANIPGAWIKENNPAEMKIIVPSWGTGPKDKTEYHILLVKETRRLYCECPGFRFRNKCHHIPYLIGFTTKPLRARGIQDTSLDAYFSIKDGLGTAQAAVYEVIRGGGPISNKDIARALGWAINRITPRVLELRRMVPPRVEDAGKVKEPGSRTPVHLWRVTGAA